MPKKLQRRMSAPKAAAAAVQKRPAAGDAGGRSLSLPFGQNRVTAKVLAEFTSQLAVLLNAGIPITKSLRILEGQMQQGAMKRIAGQLVDDVEGGTALSEAMAKHDVVFDPLYTNMVRAGEAGGVQEEILNRLSSFLVQSESIKSRVKGALAYPVAILVVAVLVLLLVFAFVIPKFRQVFATLGEGNLHWTTEWVMGIGDHLKFWWWIYLVGALGLFAGSAQTDFTLLYCECHLIERVRQLANFIAGHDRDALIVLSGSNRLRTGAQLVQWPDDRTIKIGVDDRHRDQRQREKHQDRIG